MNLISEQSFFQCEWHLQEPNSKPVQILSHALFHSFSRVADHSLDTWPPTVISMIKASCLSDSQSLSAEMQWLHDIICHFCRSSCSCCRYCCWWLYVFRQRPGRFLHRRDLGRQLRTLQQFNTNSTYSQKVASQKSSSKVVDPWEKNLRWTIQSLWDVLRNGRHLVSQIKEIASGCFWIIG